MQIDDPLRCHASLSADWYKRKARKDGTYDHARWLWLDSGHERCPRRVATWKAGTLRTYGLCRVHASRSHVFPYLKPGPTCSQPCCADDPEIRPVSEGEASKTIPEAQPQPSKPAHDEKLAALYRKVAATTLLVLDPEDGPDNP